MFVWNKKANIDRWFVSVHSILMLYFDIKILALANSFVEKI